MLVLAPPYFGREHVAAHAGRFVAAYPAVRLSFNLSNDYPDPVQEDYDLCIRIGNVIDPNFVTTKLASNRRVVCATPAYLEKHGVPRKLEDLADHNCLAVNLQADRHRDWLFQEDGKLVAVKVDGNMDCSDGEVLVRWAHDDLCLAWRSTWEVGAQLASGELVSVLDEYALPSFDITAVYPRNKPSRLARLFIAFLKDIYAQQSYWAHDGHDAMTRGGLQPIRSLTGGYDVTTRWRNVLAVTLIILGPLLGGDVGPRPPPWPRARSIR